MHFFCCCGKKKVQSILYIKNKLYFCIRKMNQLNNTTMEAKNVKNGIDWILDKKTREYCSYVAETFDNVRQEIKTYLSRINTEVIKRVLA